MEEKYLVCYPVYKFQVTSDQPRYNKRWDKSVSVCHNAILQTNILFKTPGMHSASRMDLMASNAPLHECLWNVHVDQGWKNSGITKVDHKKHMIWSNTQTIFFLISQSSLADKAPVIVTVSPTGVEQSQRRAGWKQPRLTGIGHTPTVLPLPTKTHLFLLQ